MFGVKDIASHRKWPISGNRNSDLIVFLLIVDSDSDNFLSLKKPAASKQNGLSKSTKAAAESARPGVKTQAKSPIKPSAAQSKTAMKSPVTPKSAEPKKNPTSVVDYFGNAAIQRSDKKLVASAKRKAVSGCDEHPNSLSILALTVLSIIKSGESSQ